MEKRRLAQECLDICREPPAILAVVKNRVEHLREGEGNHDEIERLAARTTKKLIIRARREPQPRRPRAEPARGCCIVAARRARTHSRQSEISRMTEGLTSPVWPTRRSRLKAKTAKILIMAIFALSLDLLVGHTGLVSFGHAAYFGVAAYALALISPKYEAANLWLTLPAAMAVAALAALVNRLFRRPHRRRLLHHGHPRLRADALLDFSRYQNRRRLRWDLHLRAAGVDHRRLSSRLDLENPVQFYYFVLILLVAVYAS